MSDWNWRAFWRGWVRGVWQGYLVVAIVFAAWWLLGAGAWRSPWLEGASVSIDYGPPVEVRVYTRADLAVPPEVLPRIAAEVACWEAGLALSRGDRTLALPLRVMVYGWRPTAGGGFEPILRFATRVRACGADT